MQVETEQTQAIARYLAAATFPPQNLLILCLRFILLSSVSMPCSGADSNTQPFSAKAITPVSNSIQFWSFSFCSPPLNRWRDSGCRRGSRLIDLHEQSRRLSANDEKNERAGDANGDDSGLAGARLHLDWRIGAFASWCLTNCGVWRARRRAKDLAIGMIISLASLFEEWKRMKERASLRRRRN